MELWSYMDVTWAIGAAASIVSASVVVAATLFAFVQVREARRARLAQVVLDYQQWHASEPFKTTRRRLFTGDFHDLTQLRAEDAAALEDVIDQLEFLGMLVDLGLLAFEMVAVLYRYSPTKVLEMAGPFIAAKRGSAPGYGVYLERLVQRVRTMQAAERDGSTRSRVRVPQDATKAATNTATDTAEAFVGGG